MQVADAFFRLVIEIKLTRPGFEQTSAWAKRGATLKFGCLILVTRVAKTANTIAHV